MRLQIILINLSICWGANVNIGILSDFPLSNTDMAVFGYFNLTPVHFQTALDIYREFEKLSPIAVISFKGTNKISKNIFNQSKIPFLENEFSIRNASFESDEYTIRPPDVTMLRYILCDVIVGFLTTNRLYVIYSPFFEKRMKIRNILLCYSKIQYKMHIFSINSTKQISDLIYDLKSQNIFQILLIVDEKMTMEILNSLEKNNILGKNFAWIIIGTVEIIKKNPFNYNDTNIYIVCQEMVYWNSFLENSAIEMMKENGYVYASFIINFLSITNLYQNKAQKEEDYLSFLKQYYQEGIAYQVWTSVNSSQSMSRILSINGNLKMTFEDASRNSSQVPLKSNPFNFSNKTIKICTIENSPFVTRKNKSGTFDIDNMSGFVIKILLHLSKTLEFRTSIYIAADGTYGGPIPKQQFFSGCVGDVQQKKAEMAASVFTFTSDRSSVVDYTYPIMSDPLAIIYHRPNESSKWFNVVYALDMKIWLMIPICMLLVSGTTTLICKHSPFSAWNLGLEFAILDEIQFSENFWTVIGSFLMQGQDFYSYPISARVVSAFWWMFSVIILAVFSADLTSYLTTDTGLKLPNTLEEFAARNDIILYLVNGSSAANIIMKSEDKVLQKLSAKSNLVPSCNKLLLNKDINNAACITDYSYVRYLVEKDCSRFAYIQEFVDSAIVGFVIPKYSEFKYLLDAEIQKLSSRGIIQNWFLEDLNQKNNTVCLYENSIPDPIGFNISLGIFFIIYSIYLGGIVFMKIEFSLRKASKRRNNCDILN